MSRKKRVHEEIRTDAWQEIFSDTMTLLLTFFVLLYSISMMNASKFKQNAISLQAILNSESGKSVVDLSAKSGGASLVRQAQLAATPNINTEDIYKKVQSFIKDKKLGTTVVIKTDNRGVILQLRENIIFTSGKADILDKSKPVLNSINALISTLPNDIVIEGHTDNVPIGNTNYKNNWQLSSDRALSVLEYFVASKGEGHPERFSSVAYGQYKPIAANSNDKSRALNRRVNILIVANGKEANTK